MVVLAGTFLLALFFTLKAQSIKISLHLVALHCGDKGLFVYSQHFQLLFPAFVGSAALAALGKC